MLSLIRCKVPHSTLLRNMISQGYRLSGKEAFQERLVDALASNYEQVLPVAIELGTKWSNKAKAGSIYGFLKEEMYEKACRDLKEGRLGLVSLSTGIPEDPVAKL